MVSRREVERDIASEMGLSSPTRDVLPPGKVSIGPEEKSDSDPIHALPVSHWIPEPRSFASVFIQENPLYYDERERWYAWNHQLKCYLNIDETNFLRLIDEALEPVRRDIRRRIEDAEYDEDWKRAERNAKMLRSMDLSSSYRQKITIALQLRARTRHYSLQIPKWYEVQFGTELYDLKTGKTRAADPAIMVRNPIPWTPSKGPHPNIDRLFSEWVSEDQQPMLRELCAFCMVPRYFIKKVFWLVGGGNNGKSSFLKLLSRIIGGRNITSSDLNGLEQNRFETSSLLDKLVCIINEVDHKTIWQNRMLKAISGEDEIRIEEKNKSVHKAVVYSKIIIAANNLPKRSDYSHANMSRHVQINFPNTFSQSGKDPVESLSDDEISNFVGTLVYDVLMGNLIESRSFTNEASIAEKSIEYDRHADSLEAFLSEYVEESEDGWITRNGLYETYLAYCKKHGLRYESYKKTNGMLRTQHGFSEGRPRIGTEDRLRPRVWLEVRWKDRAKKPTVEEYLNEYGLTTFSELVRTFGEDVKSELKRLSETGVVYEPVAGKWGLL